MDTNIQWIVPGLTFIAMLVGLFGLVIPIFPGLTVIWLCALLYGLVMGFPPVGIGVFVGISLLALGGSLVDNVLMGAKARQSGAAWSSVAVGLVAGVVGTFIIPLVGGPLLALLGLFLAEYLRRQERAAAWEATRSMAIGCGWAFIIRFAIGVVMIGLWGLWVLAA